MRASAGTSFPIALAAVLAGLTLWLRQASDLPEERGDGKLRHDPDTIIESLRAATFDHTGRPLHYLSAERLVHYPDDDSSHITRPRLRFTPADAPEMRLSAERGLLLRGREEVRLFDDVVVERLDDGTRTGWRATMPEVTAFPDLGLVRSSSDYVLVQGAARIEGTGFQADQNTRQVTLESNIRGVFPPRPRER